MANLNVNNFHNLKILINKDDYWDFWVNKDAFPCMGNVDFDDSCLLTYIDMCDPECVSGDTWVQSKEGYYWESAVTSTYDLNNISHIGMDNGLLTYRRDRISNSDFIRIISDYKYTIEEGDTRLKLHAVSGTTMQYQYGYDFEECALKLNGGFFQGFFETECDKYKILPTVFNHGDTLHFEFSLKKCDFDDTPSNTLNGKYPNNKGMFFYIGTRAENKWIYLYDREDKYGLEECYQLDMSDFVEDSKIERNKYIVSEFFDPMIEFDGYDPFELGDYTNYNYYDDDEYAGDQCDWRDMSDYLEIGYTEPAHLIDETLPHITLENCCGEEEYETVLVPFFHACGCPIKYRKERRKKDHPLSQCDEFGDNYIEDLDTLSSIEECSDYIQEELDISDFEFVTDNGFKMAEANQYYFYTDNKFMMFDRTPNGYTTRNWVDGTQMMYYGRRNKFKGNLFMLMNRTCTGYTVKNIEDLMEEDANDYNPFEDIYNNALGFRITDEGAIGYRLLTYDCEISGDNKTSVIEGYSKDGIIQDCEWTTVNVRMSFAFGKMKLMFYVNGKLAFITKELPPINLRALMDLYEKQEGVPYNISLGGGTQGLAETIMPNYMMNPTRVYPLEENFAGTFIGYISSFKIYGCLKDAMSIGINYNYERNKLKELYGE